jgi:hypothetical protein
VALWIVAVVNHLFSIDQVASRIANANAAPGKRLQDFA